MYAEKNMQPYDWAETKGFPVEAGHPITEQARVEIHKYLLLLASPEFEEIMNNDGIDMAFAEKVISFAVSMLDRGDWTPDQAHEYFLDMLQEARDENLPIDVRKEIKRFAGIIHSIDEQSDGISWKIDKARRQMCDDVITRLRQGESIESANEFYNNQLDMIGQ